MEKMFDINIRRDVVVTQEDIDDIMCTAFEGGITYWCDSAKVVGDYLGEFASEQISRGGKLILHDFEEDSYDELTLDKFLSGLEIYLTKWAEPNVIYVNECGTSVIDAGWIDAIGADMIVQLSIFGDVVYG